MVTWLLPWKRWWPWQQTHPPLIVLALREKNETEGKKMHRFRGNCLVVTERKRSYSADWSAPSCPPQRGSPASSSNSASHHLFQRHPRQFPLTQRHRRPSPRLQKHHLRCLPFQRRNWSLHLKMKKQQLCILRFLTSDRNMQLTNRPMGVLCLSVCFSWLMRGGVAPTAGPISSPSLGSVKWKEISVRRKGVDSESRMLITNHNF